MINQRAAKWHQSSLARTVTSKIHGAKDITAQGDPSWQRLAPGASAETGLKSPRRSRRWLWVFLAGVVVAVVVVATGSFVLYYQQLRFIRLEREVRAAFTSGKFDEGKELLRDWLTRQPQSPDAQYYEAWRAFAADQPKEAARAIDLARKTGLDRARLDCLAAIGQSRSQLFNDAEPILQTALREQVEPRALIAKELARIYLSTYRLDQAANMIERWRSLAPQDAEPYIWKNEVLSRSDVDPEVMIQNYRAALERDPALDKARLGLAQQLSKRRRFEEAEQEFLTYLKSQPNDAHALLGLGQDAFQQGNIEGARGYFESAVKANPQQPDALKELSQIDLRLGRFQEACKSLEQLTKIDPFDHEVRYTYSQALKLAGETARAKVELDHSARLRLEQQEIVRLRASLLQDPNNVQARFQVTKWLIDHGHADEGLRWTKEILRSIPAMFRPTSCWLIILPGRATPVWQTITASWPRQGKIRREARVHRIKRLPGEGLAAPTQRGSNEQGFVAHISRLRASAQGDQGADSAGSIAGDIRSQLGACPSLPGLRPWD